MDSEISKSMETRGDTVTESKPESEEHSLSMLQLCNGCQKERASVICTACYGDQGVRNISDPTVDQLMKNGNYVYCTECFAIVHKQSSEAHTAISIFVSKPVIQLQNDMTESTKDGANQLNLENMSAKLNDLAINIKSLNERCDQLTDVKQSIRQMNDLIKDDLYMDFGSIAVMLKSKLDELSDKVKEKLKDAYSVVRDAHVKLSNKITDVRTQIDELNKLKSELSQDDSAENRLKYEQLMEKLKQTNLNLNQVNDDLKLITEPITSSSYNMSTSSMSMFVDNYLYPQFNYFVDTSKLIQAINDLSVQISSCSSTAYSIEPSISEFTNCEIKLKRSYDCTVTSGLLSNGTFWLQLLSIDEEDQDLDQANQASKYTSYKQKFNLFIEELSKFVRKKRIGDKTWQTFAEANRVPVLNEKCFCLEPKTRKWLRARVVSYDSSKNKCLLRYMDTGNLDNTSYSLENLLVWKDSEIANMPARALNCVFQKGDLDTEYEKDICLETKFLFKDLTINQHLKCLLLDTIKTNDSSNELEDKVWIVKLYKQTDFNQLFNCKQPSRDPNINVIVTSESNNMINDMNLLEGLNAPKSINELIIEYNEQEKNANYGSNQNPYSCVDVRLEQNNVQNLNVIFKNDSDSSHSNNTDTKTLHNPEQNQDQSKDRQQGNKSRYLGVEPPVNLSRTSSASSSFAPLHANSTIVADSTAKIEAIGKRASDSVDMFSMNNETANSNQKMNTVSIKSSNQNQSLTVVSVVQPTTTITVTTNEEITDNTTNEIIPPSIDETSNNQTSSIGPVLNTDQNIDIDLDDQSDEVRFFKSRNGACQITNSINDNGIFWIRPCIGTENYNSLFYQLSDDIGQFFEKSYYRSYGELKIVPELNRKCFAKVTYKNGSHRWWRGAVESINLQRESVRVRLLDHGESKELGFHEVYPHRRLDFGNKINYLAIRCCLTPNKNIKFGYKSKQEFEKILHKVLDFDLIDQVVVNGFKCWYAEIRSRDKDPRTVNKRVISLSESFVKKKDHRNEAFDNSHRFTSLDPQDFRGSRQNKHHSENKQEKSSLSSIENVDLKNKWESIKAIPVMESMENKTLDSQEIDKDNNQSQNSESKSKKNRKKGRKNRPRSRSLEYDHKEALKNKESVDNTISNDDVSSPIQLPSIDDRKKNSYTENSERKNNQKTERPKYRNNNDGCKENATGRNYYKRDDNDDMGDGYNGYNNYQGGGYRSYNNGERNSSRNNSNNNNNNRNNGKNYGKKNDLDNNDEANGTVIPINIQTDNDNRNKGYLYLVDCPEDDDKSSYNEVFINDKASSNDNKYFDDYYKDDLEELDNNLLPPMPKNTHSSPKINGNLPFSLNKYENKSGSSLMIDDQSRSYATARTQPTNNYDRLSNVRLPNPYENYLLISESLEDQLYSSNFKRPSKDDNREMDHQCQHKKQINSETDQAKSTLNESLNEYVGNISINDHNTHHVDASTLDLTQPVANRHSNHIDKYSNRPSSRNSKNLSRFQGSNKSRSFSADVVLLKSSSQNTSNMTTLIGLAQLTSDSSNSSYQGSSSSKKKGSPKENAQPTNEEESNDESFASCAEELFRSSGNNSNNNSDNYTSFNTNHNNDCANSFNKPKNSANLHDMFLFKNDQMEFTFDQISTNEADQLVSTGGDSSTLFTNTPTIKQDFNKSDKSKIEDQIEPAKNGTCVPASPPVWPSKKEAAKSDKFCNSKLAKLKQFTISVFVDSFEDYSFNKANTTSFDSSSSTTLNTSLVVSNQNHVNANISVHVGPHPISSNTTLEPRSSTVNTDQRKIEDNEEDKDSLKEFELNETKTNDENDKTEDISVKRNAPENDDPFIYDTNPNNYFNLVASSSNFQQNILASKPPIIPFQVNNHLAPNNILKGFSNNNPMSCPIPNPNLPFNKSNLSIDALTTISECSNENASEISNQRESVNLPEYNPESIDNLEIKKSFDENKSNIPLKPQRSLSGLSNQNHTNESKQNFKSKSISNLCANESSLSEDQNKNLFSNSLPLLDSEHKIQVNHDDLLQRYWNLVQTNYNQDNSLGSKSNTDILFEKFCLISNDEIMLSPGIKSNYKSFDNESSLDLIDGRQSELKVFDDKKSAQFQQYQTNVSEVLHQKVKEAPLTLDDEAKKKKVVSLSDSLSPGSPGSAVSKGGKSTKPNTEHNNSVNNPNNTTNHSNWIENTLTTPNTLEISSYTTDSLFQLVVTPICSDPISPNAQFANANMIKSPLLSINNSLNFTGVSTPNNTSANNSRVTFSNLGNNSPQNPTPSIQNHSQLLNNSMAKSKIQKSPLQSPTYSSNNSPLSKISNVSLPLPTPPTAADLARVNGNEISSPLSPSAALNSISSATHASVLTFKLVPGVSSMPATLVKTTKIDPRKTGFPLSNSSLIESITARLNLIRVNNTLNKHPFYSEINKLTSLNEGSNNQVKRLTNVSRIQNSLESSTDKLKTEPEKKSITDNPSKENKNNSELTAVGFTLYGLDSDEEELQRTLIKDENKKKSEDENLSEKSFSSWFPPPPPPEFQSPVQNQSLQTHAIQQTIIDQQSMTGPSTSNQQMDNIILGPRLSTFLKSIEHENKDNNIESRLIDQNTNLSDQLSRNFQSSSCPDLNMEDDSENQNSKTEKQSFKLDHLLDINPKRLYINSKFRCKIHDVIDENGRFWMEVIYSKEEERKFNEIFKLFRLCSKINDPPREVYPQKRVSALYKGEWYRAVVIDSHDQDKVKVKFVDLGITKILDRVAELREIEEKFFNCPLKALKCSINLDNVTNGGAFKLSKEARKFFTRLIYKKVLYAKVIDFDHDASPDESGNLDSRNSSNKNVCKIVLGCQTKRGIIDVFMYLISKFDRARYEAIKKQQHQGTNRNLQIDIKNLIDQTQILDNTVTKSRSASSSARTSPSSMLPSPPQSSNSSFVINNNRQHQMTNNSEQIYECLNQKHKVNNEIRVEQVSDDSDEIASSVDENFEVDDRVDDSDLNNVLFSDILHINNHKVVNEPVTNHDLSDSSLISTGGAYQPSDNIYYDADAVLDYIPVKGDNQYHATFVNFPPLPSHLKDDFVFNQRDKFGRNYARYNCPTIQIDEREKFFSTNLAMKKDHLAASMVPHGNNTNLGSDTESSMHIPCCKVPFLK